LIKPPAHKSLRCRHALFAAAIYFLLPISLLHAQQWSWAIRGGGIYSDKGTDLAIDTAGNIYLSGYYNVGQPANTTATFGSLPTPGANWGKEGFLAKVSPNGTWTWLHEAIGGYDERVLGICTDNYNGYVYAVGTTWTWSPNDVFQFGGCSPNLGNPGQADEIFIYKFDLNGNCIWRVGAGSDGDDHAYDVATDKAGNVYITGFISDHYGWPGNPGTFGSFSLPLPGDSIAYVAKLNAAGVFQWVRSFDALDGERDNRIAVDSLGNAYVAGGFRGTKSFGSVSLTSAGDYDIFVTKYDPNGNVLWAKRAGSAYDDRANGVTLDVYGDVYVTGEFRDKAVFDTDTINNNGGPNGRDIFVARMKPNGNWVWAKKAGSSGGSERGDRITGNKKGTLFVTGQFKGAASFGSSISLTASVADSVQIFVAAIDTAGKWKWALQAGGSDEDRGTGLACDDSCNVYNGGFFQYTATFGTTSLSNYGKKDAYVARIVDACPMGVAVSSTNVSCSGQCDGTATAVPNGLIGPLSYTWSTSPPQNTATATSLCAGNYTVVVTDTAGGVYTQTVVISQPAALVVTPASSPKICGGTCTGSATVTVNGGTPGYSYAWSTTPVQSTNIASGLCPGAYTCVVTDASGCSVAQTFSLQGTPVINTNTSQTDLICFAQCYGSATVTASGAGPSYTYSWSTSPAQSTASASNLCAGSYTCFVTDSNGCTVAQVVTITQPLPLAATFSATPVRCNGASDGTATALVTGGIAPYTYFWNTSPPQTTATASALAPGVYQVIISDTNSCILADSVALLPVPPKDTLSISAAYCLADPTVALQAPGLGGPYQWYEAGNPVNGATAPGYAVSTSSMNNYSVSWYYKGCTYVSTALSQSIYADFAAAPVTNVFSPNGDKVNDEFLPFFVGSNPLTTVEAAIDAYELGIYDRWGRLVFATTDVKEAWKGNTPAGQPASEGTYYWISRYRTKCGAGAEVTSKGFLQLVR
jgi:gliding motility-associated-like protein